MVDKNLETSTLEIEDNLKTVDNSEEKILVELTSLQDRFLRLGAEFENFKKRTERDRQISVKFANEVLILDLLPVLDHLEQAIEITDNKESIPVLDSSVSMGIKMVIRQLEDLLCRYGVKRFSAVGEIFDPNKHEAVEQKEDAEHSGKILQEYQKGCLLYDRLIRPARVVVGK